MIAEDASDIAVRRTRDGFGGDFSSGIAFHRDTHSAGLRGALVLLLRPINIYFVNAKIKYIYI